MIMPITQAAIASVDAQPSHRSQPEITNFPMIRGCAVISIITAMTGTAKKGLDGIDRAQGNGDSENGGGGHRGIERHGLVRMPRQPDGPPARLADGIGRGTGQDRNCQQAGVATIPKANTMNANSPAIGLSASAACAEVSTEVMPALLRVAAAVRMMASAMRFEKAMPTRVSARMRSNALRACFGAHTNGFRAWFAFHRARGIQEYARAYARASLKSRGRWWPTAADRYAYSH
jgi:hypothetical protein